MRVFFTFLAFILYIQLFACCNKTNDMTNTSNNISNADSAKLKIIIGSNTFNAIVYDNAAGTTFKKRLPMTVNMAELNGNEKYFDLPANLPANASNPGTIQAGDIVLYGSNTLVIFYKSFSTSYSYTPIGRIDAASGLTAALGSGDIAVTFALQ